MSRRKTTTASSAPAADMARFRSTDENQHPLVSIEFEGLPSEVFAHAGDLHSRGHSIDVRGIRGWSELPEFAFTSYERFEQAVLIRSSKQPGAPVAPSSRFRRYTLDDLKRREPPKWIIDQAIAESNGGTIIYGAPGTFKTFIALDMALCIATDTAWHGRSVMRGGRVLYCVGEGSFDTDKRIEACLFHRGLTLPAGRFEVIEPAPLLRLHQDTTDFITEAKRGGSSWDLVVIDTIGRVMPGINDNAQDGARMFSEFVGRIREELGATVLALTHAPKNDGKAMLGSGVYEADADLVFNAECPNEADKGIRVNFRNTKNKYGEKWERDIGFERVKLAGSIAMGRCLPVSGNEVLTGAEREIQVKHILAALRSCAGKEWTVKTLAEETRRRGCKRALRTLQNSDLKAVDGWALKHSVLAPYYDIPSEKWRTPSVLPGIPSGYEIPTDDDAPAGKVAPIQRRRKRAA